VFSLGKSYNADTRTCKFKEINIYLPLALKKILLLLFDVEFNVEFEEISRVEISKVEISKVKISKVEEKSLFSKVFA
jgi:hypothetical protein